MKAALAAVAAALVAGSADPIVVTRDSQKLPLGCSPREVAGLVTEFFDAFNRGQWDEVDRLFAPAGLRPPNFQLFAFERDVVHERDRLLSFLADIRSRGERFRLVGVRVAPRGVTYAVERPSGLALGKLGIDCVGQRIWQGAVGAPTNSLRVPCPLPRGWTPAGPVVACAHTTDVPALAEEFRLGTTHVRLPRRCSPRFVLGKLRSALSAFNLGLDRAFSRHFTTTGHFHPYTGSIPTPRPGRRHVARLARQRYEDGDAWTARALLPPLGTVGLPRSAVYRLDLRVTHQTAELGTASAKVVIDCSEGLVSRWVGPGSAAP